MPSIRTAPVRKTDDARPPSRRLAVENEPEAVPPVDGDDPVLAFRWGWYLLSILIPFAGVLIGIILYDRDSRPARKIGRTSLILGFTLWVLLPLAIGVLLAILGAVTALGWVSSLMPPSP